MKKTVLFDMDGTLIDSMPLWTHIADDYLHSLGIKPDEDLEKKVFGMSSSVFVRYVNLRYLPDLSESQITSGIAQQLDNGYKHVSAKSGARGLVNAFKNASFTVCLATATAEHAARAVLSSLGLWDCFDRHFCDLKKSSPEGFAGVIHALSVPPQSCLLFDDSYYAVKNAKLAGMCAAGVADDVSISHYGSTEKISDLYYTSLDNADRIVSEVKSLLEQKVPL